MRGVTYVVDDSGAKKAVQIDLRTWGKVWEDFYDVLVSELRQGDPSVSWESLKAEMSREESATG